MNVTPQRALGALAVAGIGTAAGISLARTIAGSRSTEVDDVHVNRDVRWSPEHDSTDKDFRLADIPGQVNARLSPVNMMNRGLHNHPVLIGLGGIAGAVIGAVRGTSIVGSLSQGVLGAFAGVGLSLAALGGLEAIGTFRRNRSSAEEVGDRQVAPETVAKPGEELKVMSINIREGLGPYDSNLPRDEQWDKIEEVVKREDPDILVLQEVSVGSPQTKWHDNIAELERRLKPTDSMWNPTMTIPVGMAKGQEIMTFHGATIEDGRTLELDDTHAPGTTMRRILSTIGAYNEWRENDDRLRTLPNVMRGYHSRGVSDAMIRTPEGNMVRALSAHLSGASLHTGGDKTNGYRTQTGPLTHALDSWKGPTILGGDFNVNSRKPAWDMEHELFNKFGYNDTFSELGIPRNDPRRISYPNHGTMIDRFYVNDKLTVKETHVVTGTTASDHDPLVTTVVVG